MLYRFLRFINQWYAIAVLWVFIAAFLMALGFMFIFPQVTLGLFFIGLGALGVAVVTSGVFHALQRALARRQIATGRCPRCRATLASIPHPQASVQCLSCKLLYTLTGSEVEQQPLPAPRQTLEDD